MIKSIRSAPVVFHSKQLGTKYKRPDYLDIQEKADFFDGWSIYGPDTAEVHGIDTEGCHINSEDYLINNWEHI